MSDVIPHVGMWIEIHESEKTKPRLYGHPSRRDVD